MNSICSGTSGPSESEANSSVVRPSQQSRAGAANARYRFGANAAQDEVRALPRAFESRRKQRRSPREDVHYHPPVAARRAAATQRSWSGERRQQAQQRTLRRSRSPSLHPRAVEPMSPESPEPRPLSTTDPSAPSPSASRGGPKPPAQAPARSPGPRARSWRRGPTPGRTREPRASEESQRNDRSTANVDLRSARRRDWLRAAGRPAEREAQAGSRPGSERPTNGCGSKSRAEGSGAPPAAPATQASASHRRAAPAAPEANSPPDRSASATAPARSASAAAVQGPRATGPPAPAGQSKRSRHLSGMGPRARSAEVSAPRDSMSKTEGRSPGSAVSTGSS